RREEREAPPFEERDQMLASTFRIDPAVAEVTAMRERARDELGPGAGVEVRRLGRASQSLVPILVGHREQTPSWRRSPISLRSRAWLSPSGSAPAPVAAARGGRFPSESTRRAERRRTRARRSRPEPPSAAGRPRSKPRPLLRFHGAG